MSPALRVRRPVLSVVLVTLALVVALGVVGTVVFITGAPITSPVPVVYGAVALGVVVWATVRHRWSELGYRRVSIARVPGVIGFGAAVLVVGIAVATSSGPLHQGVADWAALVAFAVLVAFVEETLFRGVFVTILLDRGPLLAVVLSSALFAVAHSVNLLGGEAPGAAVRQVVFAFAFGLVASSLFLASRSLLPALVFHAVFDTVELGSRGTSGTADWVMSVVLLVGAAALWSTSDAVRHGPRRTVT